MLSDIGEALAIWFWGALALGGLFVIACEIADRFRRRRELTFPVEWTLTDEKNPGATANRPGHDH